MEDSRMAVATSKRILQIFLTIIAYGLRNFNNLEASMNGGDDLQFSLLAPIFILTLFFFFILNFALTNLAMASSVVLRHFLQQLPIGLAPRDTTPYYLDDHCKEKMFYGFRGSVQIKQLSNLVQSNEEPLRREKAAELDSRGQELSLLRSGFAPPTVEIPKHRPIRQLWYSCYRRNKF